MKETKKQILAAKEKLIIENFHKVSKQLGMTTEIEAVASDGGFTIDKYGDRLKTDKAWSGFNFAVPEYKTKVKDSLVHIIVNERNISEKAFSDYNKVIDEVKQLFITNTHLNDTIHESEKLKNRPEFVAEKIYNEVYFSSNRLNESKAKNEFKRLQDNKVPLTDEERKQVMDAEAIWHHGPNGEATSAIWKSKNPKTGKVTYITNTHRAYNTAPTLKGAIGRYHTFIKGTA